MEERNNKLSVFLSHSHKDVEKVRRIRDLLELLECEPIIFFLKCLDDENGELEDFIKREIDARNVFLYCKSKNAEQSVWVQKELEYIKSFPDKRWGEINIDEDFTGSMINFLISIRKFVKRNRVSITCCRKDIRTAEKIRRACEEKGYAVQLRGSALPMDTGSPFTGFASAIKDSIRTVARDGIMIFLLSEDALSSNNFISEVNYALGCADSLGGIVVPVVIDKGRGTEPVFGKFTGLLSDLYCLHMDEEPREGQIYELLQNLNRINN